MKQAVRTLLLISLAMVTLNAGKTDKKKKPPVGINDPGVQRPIANIHPDAVFPIPGFPDWVLILPDSVWIGNKPKNTITRLDPKTNMIVTTIAVGQLPCSGLAAGFGSVWVPNCGDKTLSQIDIVTNKVVATIPLGPADSEGTIAASEDSIWYLTDPKGTLTRIDPATNQAVADIPVPPDSFAAAYGEGSVWVTNTAGNTLTRVDPKTNLVTATIPVGLKPRLLAVGEGAVWTLNQGDGSVSRIDPKTNRVAATIETGVPGPGGDIAVGAGSVWVTMDQVPLMRIDIATHKVVQQWLGPGGDSLRVGLGSVWLTNHKEQNVWRFHPMQP
jgi:YVTN family beta-propeller protein